VGENRVVVIRSKGRRLSRRSWFMEFINGHGAKRHGHIPSLIVHSRGSSHGSNVHKRRVRCGSEYPGSSNKGAVAIVARSIKVGAIVVSTGIKNFLLAGEWILPIKDGWVPVHIASHDDMRQGLEFLVSKRTKIQVGQTIADMEGKLIPIIRNDELTIGIHTPRTLIDLVMERFQLSRGKNGGTPHDSSKLVKE
jgi:hypothetical protein